MTIGEQIVARRMELGISQQSLAKAVDVSPAMMCKIERGRRQPGKKLLRKIIEVLGLDEPLNFIRVCENESMALEMLETKVLRTMGELETMLSVIRALR